MTRIYNRSTEKDLRRKLRREMPRAEVLLWTRLRNRQLLGLKFRRQYSVESYSIDFYCAELKLAIELDGDSHGTPEAIEYDKIRQTLIEQYGIQFLRFWNVEVYQNLEGVLDTIEVKAKELQVCRTSPRPSPSQGEGAKVPSH